MKIVATVRTKNEEANIGRFCEAYQSIADLILIADGGSEDRTVEIALSYQKVNVEHFRPRFETLDGGWLNPQGKHTNFLIFWALYEGADWIIFDDCDCVPNKYLRKDARMMMQTIPHDAIFARRIYMWGNGEHFPDLSAPNTSLWAWRSDWIVYADEEDEWHLTMNFKGPELRKRALSIEEPYCLLHRSWPTPEEAEIKVAKYRSSGQQPTAISPLEFGGKLAPIDWYMVDK